MLMLASVLVLLCGCSGGGGSSLASLPGVVQPTIVASASPTLGSTASPGSVNNPTGSPTDEEGSGSGNPGSDPTASLLPEDELNRLFPNLPPDPGEEGKRTLEGIDADGDGVRDDVQRAIYRLEPRDERKRRAMLQYAKALQRRMFARENIDAFIRANYASIIDRSCLQQTFEDDGSPDILVSIV
ncbi:hypothetical protein [Thermostichus vulcanus]|uniref:Uncharacterized protein n=1 Tax=Thermostichus vulcanus str. 'Rupite' TaxID=2813851 RepID=A0ABT0CFZ2_THEVL|nr:hypothetical protein [Thermostichus vulcanus]MCJ2544664.1 hypothetical protein [Thermostichus vulcanus str. 'Rupite']